MRYLRDTLQFSLVNGGLNEKGYTLVGYIDSDFVGDLDKRMSQIGY